MPSTLSIGKSRQIAAAILAARPGGTAATFLISPDRVSFTMVMGQRVDPQTTRDRASDF
jgi:hypothetical protein